MARLARGEYPDPRSIQIVHVTSRCVRRAFLCGRDHWSGKDHEHRRQWIRDELEFLASIFGIDFLTYAVMSNHFHVVLRSRPDIVRAWTDEQVARRWLRLCPMRKDANGRPCKPTETELNMLTADFRKMAELRIRLSDISWWMRRLNDKIARKANREDECSGRFWEGRFQAQPLLDEASVLACSVYVDLNPVRAALAETPEESEFTGARDRINDLSRDKGRIRGNRRADKPGRSRVRERSQRRKHSTWMSPLQIDEKQDPVGADASCCGRRASLKGFLSIPLPRYLELLDWTGRQLRRDKRDSIPHDLVPILARLGIEPQGWCELVKKFGHLFKRAAGTAESIRGEAHRRRQNWLQAPGVAYLG